MKKCVLILIVVALGMMVLALPASAGAYFTIQTHGGWTTSTAGCADCHTTHAANAAFLLASGPTQTDACYACHGPQALSSPYDVVDGAMSTDYDYAVTGNRTKWTTGYVYGSFAGGFNETFDFQNAIDAGVGVLDDAQANTEDNFVPSQSAHNVEQPANAYAALTIPGTAWVEDTVYIPGGSKPISTNGTFRCGDCHDPHGGTNSNAEARLLKKYLPASGVARPVDFTLAVGAVNTATYRVDSYPESINFWCAGCHDYFDAADGAGHTKTAENKYRHPMGIEVEEASPDGDFSIAKGTPLANDGGNQLTCFSCHRAHGSAATVSGAASSFIRYNTDIAGNGTGSVLLRLKDRDTCYNCHGAATANTYRFYHGGAGTH